MLQYTYVYTNEHKAGDRDAENLLRMDHDASGQLNLWPMDISGLGLYRVLIKVMLNIFFQK